jgi:hypothetical protein
MLSSDRLEAPGRRRRRKARRNGATPGAVRIDANEPWDFQAAEALMRLHESDEGQLHKPHVGERTDRAIPMADAAAGQAGADDRAWLETHLSDLVERLHASLVRLDPEASLAALNGRLEAIEERFGRALERVAQRADVHGVRAIEAHVLELAEHLEKTRDRLQQIGTLEEEVRGLAQRFDAADQQQTGALGKLLRDYIGEWRESEQRTSSALHSLEEAVSRLGDSVDAMEASKPAPDLSFATLAVPDPARACTGSDPLAQGSAALTAKSYHSTLDAADYAPQPACEEPPPGDPALAQGRRRLMALPGAAIAWPAASAEDASSGGHDAREPEARTTRIMAVRAKLRRARMVPAEAANADGAPAPATGEDAQEPATIKRTRSGLLVFAAIALLAGGAYLLVHLMTAAAPPRTVPARTESGVQPSGAKPDPTPRPAAATGTAG